MPPAHTVGVPVTTGVGFGLMVTLKSEVPVLQPVVWLESVTAIVPAPAEPHVTVKDELPWPAVMVPPVTLH